MSETNGRVFDEKPKNLKKADSKKSQGEVGTTIRNEILGGGRIRENSDIKNIKIKRRLPVAIDIIAGALMLVLMCGVVAGSYFLFRYYSNDYDSVNVTYRVAFVDTAGNGTAFAEKDGRVFLDTESNSVYFGKITGVDTEDNGSSQSPSRIFLTIEVNAKYRKGEGYSLGDERLAVGSSFVLRYGEKTKNVTVVELSTGGK